MVMGMKMISALNIIKTKINNIVVNATTDTIRMKLQFNKNTDSNRQWKKKKFQMHTAWHTAYLMANGSACKH